MAELRTDNSAAMLQALTQLIPMFAGSSSKQTETTTGGTKTTKRMGDDAIKQLTSLLTSGQYSKEAATADTQASMQALVQSMLESGVPQIAGAQVGTGAYNQSTSKLLMDNLVAKTAAEGAALQQKTIADYAAIQQGLANTLKDAKTVEVIPSTSTTVKSSKDPMIDPMLALGIGGALWGANKLGLFDIFGDDDESNVVGSGRTPGINPSASPLAGLNISPTRGLALNQGANLGSISNVSSTLGSGGVNPGASIGGSISPGGWGVNIGMPLGCFITTAVCKASGKPDDCYELRTLRRFRDIYMNSDPNRSMLVEQYYQEAPSIVRAIDSLGADADHIYEVLKDNYIIPAIEAIEDANMELAMNIYKAMFIEAKSLAEKLGAKHG